MGDYVLLLRSSEDYSKVEQSMMPILFLLRSTYVLKPALGFAKAKGLRSSRHLITATYTHCLSHVCSYILVSN